MSDPLVTRRVGHALLPVMRLLLAVAVSALVACAGRPSIRPFYSDGCSLFPDGKVGERGLWCDCCFAHDIAYWRGGTAEDRLMADRALRTCVFEKTRDPKLAAVMYEGVRFGGSPVFLNWYRWGYGWPYGRGYAPLTDEERAQADAALAEYSARNPAGYCARE